MILDSDQRKPVERKNERGGEQELRLESKRQRARMRNRNGNNCRDLIFFLFVVVNFFTEFCSLSY